jgi:LysM repeat protein
MRTNYQTINARCCWNDVILVLVISLITVGVSTGYSVAHVHPPATEDPAVTNSAFATYVVASGDDLGKIATKHGFDAATGWRLLYEANPSIADPDVIMPGQQLRIPAPDGQASPRPPITRLQKKTESVWDRLAQCESRGNWSTHVGTFDGGLQFHPKTWRAYGGTQYAPSADQATRTQQIAVAERVLAGQGWRAWPACSRKLGLR